MVLFLRTEPMTSAPLSPPELILYEEFDVVLEVAVVIVVVIDNTKTVGEDPHLHGSIGTAGKDVVGGSHLDLHDPCPEVPEQRLASMLVGEGVECSLCGEAPNLGSPEGNV